MSTPVAISRRAALRLSAGGLLAAGLWPGALRAAGNGKGGEFTFVVVNDLHYLNEKCGPWFEKLVAQMKVAKPELCLMVGDWTEHGLANQLEPVRDAFKALGAAVHGVIGNHDYLGIKDRSAYEKAFPDRINYHVEHRDWQLVALDSSAGQLFAGFAIQPHTLRWLDENLPKLDKRKPLIVQTHFPLGPDHLSRPLNADAVLERFKEHNLQTVFNGHFHGLTERKLGEVALTTNRCCSFARRNHDGSKEKGYFLCRAKDGKITREFVEMKLV